MRRFAVLLHLYLIFRIVACPCLSGENFHDGLSRAFFGWAGSATLPSDPLADPSGTAEAGVCMCDGAVAPDCLDMAPSAPSGPWPDAPSCLGPLAILGVDDLTPAWSSRPAPIGPEPVDALTLRARLQNFRC